MALSISEFDALILDPSTSLPAIDRLGGGRVRCDAQGDPVRTAGEHTVVYEIRTSSGRMLVLRTHLHPDPQRDRALAQRYAALEVDPVLNSLRAPDGPLPADIQWIPDGLRWHDMAGNQASRAVVAMERVPGRTLREMVTRLCRERDGLHLSMIADSWLESALALESVGFVHGDLGPDNIMVRPDGSIAIVDLDTASWPGLQIDHDVQGRRSALRHPQGLPRNDALVDRFPAFMMWASLRILATQPELLPATPAAGLLFSNADVRRPSDAPIFTRLDDSDDSLRLLLEVVRRAVRFAPEDLPALSEIASRLESLGFPRLASGSVDRTRPATQSRPAKPTRIPAVPVSPQPPPVVAPPQETMAQPLADDRIEAVDKASEVARLEALRAAIQRRDGREALRIWNDARNDPPAQVYATAIHQLVEQEARGAIERALRRRDDDALLQAIAQAETVGVALDAPALAAARAARRRAEARAALRSALRTEDRSTLANLQRTGQLEELGHLEPTANRALARALAWPSIERALASDDDVAICAAADPGVWREEETHPHAVWTRLDLAWHRSRWTQDVRAALRRRDGAYLRGLLAKAPTGAEERLTEVERRRVRRVIARDQATTRLERALREGPDREVVEALAELEASGASFSDALDWSAVRGVVDRLSLADALRVAMSTDPPDTERMVRLLPAARAALGDLQHAGPEWAELEQAVLRAAHLERLREAMESGDDASIAAAADPDPFQVRLLLTEEETALVAAVLRRTRTQVRRHAS